MTTALRFAIEQRCAERFPGVDPVLAAQLWEDFLRDQYIRQESELEYDITIQDNPS